MKKVFLTLIIVLFAISGFAQKAAFKVGEKLTFEAYYAFVTGARITIEVKQDNLGGKPYTHVVAKGSTVGLIDKIYKIFENYESWFDVDNKCLPIKGFEDVHEGKSYTRKCEYTFDNANQKVYSVKKRNNKAPHDTIFKVEKDCYDLVSAAFYIRTLDLTDVKPGFRVRIPTVFDFEPWPLIVEFKQMATIKVGDLGKVRCYEFVPVVETTGGVFSSKDALHIFLTADQNKIPVRAQMDLYVGSCKVDLVDYQNLNNNFDAKVK